MQETKKQNLTKIIVVVVVVWVVVSDKNLTNVTYEFVVRLYSVMYFCENSMLNLRQQHRPSRKRYFHWNPLSKEEIDSNVYSIVSIVYMTEEKIFRMIS